MRLDNYLLIGDMMYTFDKVLRRIYGPVRDEKCWLINFELKQLYENRILDFIKVQRLSWARHVARMGDEQLAKRVIGQFAGTNSRGRPRTRCRHLGEKDARVHTHEKLVKGGKESVGREQ